MDQEGESDMAELANCETCGKVFVKTASPICPSCRKELEEKFERVWRYIRKKENREATVIEVHEATGVEEKLIFQWIKEGRLKVKEFVNLAYPCASCGKPIQTGNLCEACASRLKKDLDRFEADEEMQKKEKKPFKTYYTQGHEADLR